MTIEIHPRAGPVEPGHFPFEVKPVPATPTNCRGCDVVLEPMRRYAGLCRECVIKRSKRRRRQRPMRVVQTFVRAGEKHLEVECGCGARRVMRLSTYNAQRPQTCKRCRLRAVSRHGFEAEYARPKPTRNQAARGDR